jgi:hypothetical protein
MSNEIKKYEFIDDVLSFKESVKDRLELWVSPADDYIIIYKRDVIEMAKHFNIKHSDL